MKHLLLIVTNSIVSILLFVYLFFSVRGQFPEIKNEGNAFLLALLFGLLFGYTLWYLNVLLQKIWSWKKFPILRLIIGVSFLTSTSWLLARFSLPIFVQANAFFKNKPVPSLAYQDLFLQIGILFFTLIFIFLLIDYLVFSYRNFLFNNVKVIEQQKEKSQLQLEMLQKQLSPHYLFNSLNTISNLIETSAQNTEKYIRKLVNTYQYILSISTKELVTVAEELKMIKAYQYQLEVRFGKAILWNYSVGEEFLSYKMPPLSMQILIENAVKHNIASEKNPLQIVIKNENNYISLSNNITERPRNPTSHKIGLNNLKRRYALLGTENLKIVKDANFTVKLPIIKTDISDK